MRITAIAVAGLVAGTLVTASPARAEVTAQPALSHFYPQQPSFTLSPLSDVEELRRQIADLDASWESLTPAQRNQRIAQLQQLVTNVDMETRNLPPDQQAPVEAALLPSIVHLGDILRKQQTPPTSPCIFPLCLPGL
jgi:hypothetical protein